MFQNRNPSAIHSMSSVQPKIGAGTSIWQFCVDLVKAQLADNCNICTYC